jgi:hypothetical protein
MDVYDETLCCAWFNTCQKERRWQKLQADSSLPILANAMEMVFLTPWHACCDSVFLTQGCFDAH